MDEATLSAIRAEYRKLEHSGSDAYQTLVYNILGQCDARKAFNQKLPYARWTTQDYLVPFPPFSPYPFSFLLHLLFFLLPLLLRLLLFPLLRLICSPFPFLI